MMTFDLAMFADKLKRYCSQFDVSQLALSESTGIQLDRLDALSNQESEPTGDEILILADYFKCDFKFFISNEKLAPFEQTEKLFRMHGDDLTTEDKWAIQEFLFLCECQEYLLSNTESDLVRNPFVFSKRGTYYKGHGQEAAAALHNHLGYKPNAFPADIYRDFTKIGIHIFRRQLGQSNISGIFIRHPVAGPCVLVNYSEDVFRQRFTVAHEVAHTILDDETDFIVSYSDWDREELSEIRANTFASHFLIPPLLLRKIPEPSSWDQQKLLYWAKKLLVNTEPLIIALKEADLIDKLQIQNLRGVRIPPEDKPDPELPKSLSPMSRKRKVELLRRGLSEFYVGLCFDAYGRDEITAGRLVEMLLVDEHEISALAILYNRNLVHVD